jgi:Flp pilus assembly protein TadG
MTGGHPLRRFVAGGRAHNRRPGEAGQSLVELTLAMPLLILIMLASADFGRAFYAHIIIAGAAQKGAIYASSSAAAAADQTGIQNAALADTTTLFDRSPANPTVTSVSSTDPYGFQTVDVTVTYDFRPLIPYPGLPGTFTMARSVGMRVKP